MKIKSLIKKIFALSIVSGFIFTSCNTETEYIETTATTSNASVVYHFHQNQDGIGFYSKTEDIEHKEVLKGTTITELAKNYDGFSAVNMTLVTLPNGESAVNVFYERNTVVLTIKCNGKRYEVSGLFDTPTTLPDVFSEPGNYVSFNTVWPKNFPARSAEYSVTMKKLSNFIEMKKIGNLQFSSTEITQELYTAIMGKNPSRFAWDPAAGENQNKRPVDSVSFYDALVFCNKLSVKEGFAPVYSIKGTTDTNEWGDIPGGNDNDWNAVKENSNANGFRLPHGEEWKAAAGDVPTNKGDYGWFDYNSDRKTHEIGKKTANANELYDMFGNVWELGWDLKGDKNRSRLGGCCTEGDGNSDAWWDVPPEARWDSIGFRVVKKAD